MHSWSGGHSLLVSHGVLHSGSSACSFLQLHELSTHICSGGQSLLVLQPGSSQLGSLALYFLHTHFPLTQFCNSVHSSSHLGAGTLQSGITAWLFTHVHSPSSHFWFLSHFWSGPQGIPLQSGSSPPFLHAHFLSLHIWPCGQSLLRAHPGSSQAGILALGLRQTHLFLAQACSLVHSSQGAGGRQSGSRSLGFSQPHSPSLHTWGDKQSSLVVQLVPLQSGSLAASSWHLQKPSSHFCLGGHSPEDWQGVLQSGGVASSILQTQRWLMHLWSSVHSSQPLGPSQLGGLPWPSVHSHLPFLRIVFSKRKICLKCSQF